jgi:hypothetical protein
MLSSIHPFGERARGSRWGITVTAYVAGAVAGGALVGGVLGAAGFVFLAMPGVPVAVTAVAALGVAGIGLLVDSGLGRFRVPSIRRQVDEDWLNAYRGWVYGAGFGFQLGLAFDVIVTTAAVYAAFALALLSASPAAGLAIGSVFGLVRGAAILTAARVTTPELLRRFHRRLQALGVWARKLVVATEAGVVAALVAFVVLGVMA